MSSDSSSVLNQFFLVIRHSWLNSSVMLHRISFSVLSAIIIMRAISSESGPPRVLCMQCSPRSKTCVWSLPATVCLQQQPRAYWRNLCLKGSGWSVGRWPQLFGGLRPRRSLLVVSSRLTGRWLRGSVPSLRSSSCNQPLLLPPGNESLYLNDSHAGSALPLPSCDRLSSIDVQLGVYDTFALMNDCIHTWTFQKKNLIGCL